MDKHFLILVQSLLCKVSLQRLQGILNALLQEDCVRDAAKLELNPTQAMRQVRYLILRNKADILGKSDGSATDAIQLYKEALSIDSHDASLFNKLGSLVRHTTKQNPASMSAESASIPEHISSLFTLSHIQLWHLQRWFMTPGQALLT